MSVRNRIGLFVIMLALTAPSVSWGAQCSDGQDNDLDGLADFPFDPGCTGPEDPSERDAGLICDDGLDDNGNGYADSPYELGCTDPWDTDEDEAGWPCWDGIDNDGDGLIDTPEDPGCGDGVDEVATCDDGLDNDGDGLVDHPEDPGCLQAWHNTELGQCQDGQDDDGDGLVDWPDDPGCASAEDTFETDPTLVCDNGLDDDNDELPDASDPGCADAFDTSESEGEPIVVTGCSDGIDNDGDGDIDRQDDGCRDAYDSYVPAWNEIGACADGWDNDGDGLVDWPSDPDCVDADGTEHLADAAILTLWRETETSYELTKDGRIYAGAQEVLPNGSFLPLLGPAGDGEGGVPYGDYDVWRPETDPEGNRYLKDWIWNHNAFRVAADGTVTLLLGPVREGQFYLYPREIRYGADGFVYVMAGDAMWTIGPGDTLERRPLPEGYDGGLYQWRTRDFAVDAHGTIYLRREVASNDPRVRPGVLAVDPDGTVRRLIDSSGDGRGHPLRAPNHMAVSSDGVVYVAGKEHVFRIDRSGEIEWLMGPDGDGLGNRLSSPRVAVDQAGDAWISGVDHTFFVSREGGLGAVASLPRGEVVTGWDGTNYLTDGKQHFILEMPPVCSNGIDDDGDGQTDFPEDPFCLDADWHTETWQPRCGLGFELVFVLPPLLWLRRRVLSAR